LVITSDRGGYMVCDSLSPLICHQSLDVSAKKKTLVCLMPKELLGVRDLKHPILGFGPADASTETKATGDLVRAPNI
jgi:hypothetical protein